MTGIELANDTLVLDVLPELGGGVARFERRGPGGPVPLFRGWDGRTWAANALGCFPLVPFSNRLGGGGIEAGGRFWPLPANRPPEPYPLHGDGFQKAWQIVERSPERVVLGLESHDLPPFAYRAALSYALDGAAMTMRLRVEHLADTPVPYGLGFHPWLPRTVGTRLEAPAARVWLEKPDHLPEREIDVAERPEWDFSEPRVLPDGFINNAFTGWPGKARVTWPETGAALAIEASAELANYIVYSPGAAADFFCFEPVSHVVDAHRLPGQPGLRLLEQGQHFEVDCRFTAVDEEVAP